MRVRWFLFCFAYDFLFLVVFFSIWTFDILVGSWFVLFFFLAFCL